jgi:molybdenum cofactor cytidylyltransferase
MDGERIRGILLAAGSSRRFGSDKLSARIAGVPMLTRAAALLLAAGLRNPVVVLAPDRPQHRALLAGLPVCIVENAAAASGMASSLRAGLEAAAGAAAALVAVCDQPAVTARHLRALIAAWRGSAAGLAASSYGAVRGVPAVFSASYFDPLQALAGDRGAGALLSLHADRVATVPLPGGERDIDIPADLM